MKKEHDFKMGLDKEDQFVWVELKKYFNLDRTRLARLEFGDKANKIIHNTYDKDDQG